MTSIEPGATNPAPGWYPDPVTPGMTRWWDGHQWAASGRPAALPGAYGQSSMPPGVYAAARAAYQPTFTDANKLSLITLGIAALYVVLAMQVHIVFLGILPISMGARAMSRKEPLGIVALVAAIAVAILGVAAFAHA